MIMTIVSRRLADAGRSSLYMSSRDQCTCQRTVAKSGQDRLSDPQQSDIALADADQETSQPVALDRQDHQP